ncbi:MAG: hypothetical protein WD355_02615 [Balneolaceae bacterium]
MERIGKLAMVGIFLVLIPLFAAAIYFLFPYIHQERYQEISEENSLEAPFGEADREMIGMEFEDMQTEILKLSDERNELLARIDSLTEVNRVLDEEIERLNSGLSEGDISLTADPAGQEDEEDQEEFTERVKSLLNLDEEELAPIVSQMSTQQLIRLYNGGGTIQREKLLRSLNPEKAAELMSEVML